LGRREVNTEKWSAVVILKETHFKLKDLAKAYNLNMSATMEHLVTTAWNEMYAHRTPVVTQEKKDPTVFRSKA
jgi:hypothetical protein